MKEKLIFEKNFCFNETNFIVQFYKTNQIALLNRQHYIEFLLFDCQTYLSEIRYLDQNKSAALIHCFNTDIDKAMNAVKKTLNVEL